MKELGEAERQLFQPDAEVAPSFAVTTRQYKPKPGVNKLGEAERQLFQQWG